MTKLKEEKKKSWINRSIDSHQITTVPKIEKKGFRETFSLNKQAYGKSNRIEDEVTTTLGQDGRLAAHRSNATDYHSGLHGIHARLFHQPSISFSSHFSYTPRLRCVSFRRFKIHRTRTRSRSWFQHRHIGSTTAKIILGELWNSRATISPLPPRFSE